ncbi:peptidoglycan L-alanyl-D-glutamate endopeptidase CwlK [Alkalibaculum bacchi]|uniref:Peptidoglycan L-alanyl-D-glutamate endopeptidase CwlK n=1 Tax=Alkalibaculum bacchi TaxID=645887 RepID=A0A366I4K9_9FIRM|nr:M15 family metallopeptidase [Alkalibaculum bacchi]RBP61367.1 peptidoglycan L-alanyl-D-glutamate endopeptidase CwlK [Alkalibaculum bacchi]
MRKRIVLFLIILIFLSLIFIVLPKIGFYTFVFDQGEYEHSDESSTERISDLNELSPKTRELALEFLEKCEENGLNVRITETYRTQARQDILYEQGRTTPGLVVTWTKNSKHTKRHAFDICEDDTDDPYGDLEFFRKCAEIGKEVGFTPGYYFDEVQDMPHYELNRWWIQ